MSLTIDQLLDKGIEAHKEGKLQEAEHHYRAILNSDPNHHGANHNLGLIAVSVNNHPTALALFKKALDSNPNNEQYWLSYIGALIKDEQFENSREVIEKLKTLGFAEEKLNALESHLDSMVQRENFKSKEFVAKQKFSKKSKKLAKNKKKKNSQIQNSKAIGPSQEQIKNLVSNFQTGQYANAEETAMAIIREFPGHQFSWKVLGVILRQTGRLSESLAASQKSVECDPRDVEAHNNLGATLMELGRFGEAETCYKQALALDSDHAQSHYNLAITLKFMERIKEAEQSCRQAITLEPDYAEAHYNLGVMLKELGKHEDAESSYRVAIKLKPDFVHAHYNLGNTLQSLNRLDEAEDCYRRAIELNPSFAEAHNNLGRALQVLGRSLEAEDCYRRSIDLNFNYADAHHNLGSLQQALGRMTDAEASYRQSIELNPDRPEVHNNLGIVLQILGKPEQAENSYRKAIELSSDYAVARSNLGILLCGKGRYEESIKYLDGNRELHSQSYLLKCYYQLNDRVRFYNQLDFLIDEGEISPVIGSLTMRAEIRYGEKRKNVFATNPFEYAVNVHLSRKYDFELVFVQALRSLRNEQVFSYKAQKLLTNGKQTAGNIFSLQRDPIRKIENIIRAEIEGYRALFENCREGFLDNWPTAYNINGWLIEMKSGGELAPHMHERGWLSGAVYIHVPKKKKPNMGNFTVCVDDDISDDAKRQNQHKIIEVQTGDLVLFPASLMHYTIPFESDEERIVLAFDIIPKN